MFIRFLSVIYPLDLPLSLFTLVNLDNPVVDLNKYSLKQRNQGIRNERNTLKKFSLKL